MDGKEQIVCAIKEIQLDIDEVSAATPEAGWMKGVYEQGWNAKQILCHIAATSDMSGVILRMAQSLQPPAFLSDDFNQQQVDCRSAKSSADLLAEIHSNFQRDIESIRAASDAVITQHYRAPWGLEGTVSDVIVNSLRGHLGIHLADLKASAWVRPQR